MRLTRRFAIGGGLACLASGVRAQASDGRASKLIAAATAQVGVTTIYDPAYVRLTFPGGDVPRERGVCTDVVVRAYRDAFGIDLQLLVNADMKAQFSSYPATWGLRGPDPSIDHRRVGNLRAFLTRKGAALPVPHDLAQWLPGDIVTQELAPPGSSKPGLAHIGIISEAIAPSSGRRLVIHNIGAGTRVEDILASYRINGRYRWLPS